MVSTSLETSTQITLPAALVEVLKAPNPLSQVSVFQSLQSCVDSGHNSQWLDNLTQSPVRDLYQSVQMDNRMQILHGSSHHLLGQGLLHRSFFYVSVSLFLNKLARLMLVCPNIFPFRRMESQFYASQVIASGYFICCRRISSGNSML